MGLPSSKNAVHLHMGVCKQLPKQQVVKRNTGQVILSFKSLHFSLLTLLSAANAWQTCSRNVREHQGLQITKNEDVQSPPHILPRSRPLRLRRSPPGETGVAAAWMSA